MEFSTILENISLFVRAVAISFIALFPVINPLGNAFIVNPFFEGVSQKERKAHVRKIALYTFYFCTIIVLTGHWILQLFGITVPVVRLAGGMVIFMIGWNILSGKSDHDSNEKSVTPNADSRVSAMLLYPITFPITAGAGTIAVLLTLASHSTEHGIGGFIFNTAAVIVALILMSILIYFLYYNSSKITERLGDKNKVIVNKIFAFLIMCVAIEIATTGIKELFLS